MQKTGAADKTSESAEQETFDIELEMFSIEQVCMCLLQLLVVLFESGSEATNELKAWPWLVKDGLSACKVCEWVCTGEGWWVLLHHLHKGG